MATIRCPHCGTMNDSQLAGDFCVSCDQPIDRRVGSIRATPDERPTRLPRPADGYDDDGDDLPRRREPVVTPEMTAARQQVSASLFGVAVLFLLCNIAGVFVDFSQMKPGEEVEPEAMVVFLVVFGVFIVAITAVFAGLGIWARYQPLPPAIIGLAVYLPITLGHIAFLAAFAPEELPRAGWIGKVIITVMLIQGISTAWKARQAQTNASDVIA